MTVTEEKQVRQLDLTSAQFEHTLGILGELDLAPLLAAFGGKGRSLVDMLAVLPALVQVREKRIFRRLEGIWTASPDELERAEADKSLMESLERQGAKQPIIHTLAGLAAFFDGLGLSLNASPASSVNDVLAILEKMTAEGPAPDPALELSHSGD